MITIPTSLERLRKATAQLIDDQVGVIRTVWEFPRESGAPPFFHFYAEASNTRAFTRQKNFETTGGVSTDRNIAMAKAIGEAVERYCSAIYDANDFPLISYDAAPFLCVAPSEFALYSSEQYRQREFPYVPFDNSVRVRWTAAMDAETGEAWHVPAATVYMPYFFDELHGESSICQRMSTGLACQCSFTEAAISAICEVVERDAFTITWQAKLGMPQIRINSLSKPNRDLVARFEITGSSVTLLNLAMDHGIPTILSVLRSNVSTAPALVFAAATSLSPEQAVRKSLEELAHTRRLAQQIKTALPAFSETPAFENVETQNDHVHVYCNHSSFPLADFIFASKERMDFTQLQNLDTYDAQKNLELLIKRIRAIKHRVLLVDLTTPDITETGLSVVRAVIPGFHPLSIGHRLRALGGLRLWQVPQRLGHEGIKRDCGDNTAPHPFP
jgi:ribosomal protein S12 methylthiotransferase accessory factor